MYSNKANIGSYLSGYWKSDILMYKSVSFRNVSVIPKILRGSRSKFILPPPPSPTRSYKVLEYQCYRLAQMPPTKEQTDNVLTQRSVPWSSSCCR